MPAKPALRALFCIFPSAIRPARYGPPAKAGPLFCHIDGFFALENAMKLNLKVCVVCGLITGLVIALGTWCYGDDGEIDPLCPLMKGLVWSLILGMICLCAATEHDPDKETNHPEPFFPMLGKSLAFGLAACVPFGIWQLCCMCG
jgi:hypothetical protein